jgi:hypothetical protein
MGGTIKGPGDKTKTVATVAGAARGAQIATEDSACTILGFQISTGAQFIKRFMTLNMAQSWMLTGDAADIEVVRMLM